MKNRFNRVFSKEGKSGEQFPKVSIDIFYSSHETKRDVEGLKRRFKKADIFVPELSGWTPEALLFFNNASSGKMKLIDMVGTVKSSPYLLELSNIIYNSGKPIVFIDVPYDHHIIEKYPGLGEKKKVKILLSLGSFHTRIFQSLKKSGEEVTREFKTMPTYFNFEHEGIRRCLFGGDVDDKLAAKIFLQMLFTLRRLDADIRFRLERKIVSQFSFEEAKEIFERIKQGENEVQLIKSKLEEKGFKIPQTEKELDAFLARHGTET